MRNERLVEVIAEYIQREGCPPNVREVAEMAGKSSSADGHRLLVLLEQEGLIERTPGRARGIRLKGARMKAVTEEM